MSNIGGILPALVTPLDGQGKLNTRSYELLLERVYRAGSHGVYVCGQTGEGLQLPLDVRERAVEVAVANTPEGGNVIAHVGAHSTADALRLARHASAAGAHAVSSLPPGSGYTFQEALRYYQAIASASSVPLLVYYFPGHSTAIQTTEELLKLCELPNVIGLKYTSFDLYKLSLLQRAGYTVFNGHDEVLAAGLLMGAHGGIGSFYNLIPELFVNLYAVCREGRWREAREKQDRINDLIRAVLDFPMLPSLKRILSWSGIDCGYAIPPRGRLTSLEEEALRQAVVSAGFSPEELGRGHAQ
ncbi:MAG: dihydrodipicolinate synthase family protein [Bryobacterales bacterium]|nr:dihydrodipicolinate synthase family protein [Bryobacterales bacterium]